MTVPPVTPHHEGPLAGLRIVEVSAYVATPLAGMTLAQLGADVIRVEPLGGQVDRDRMPLSPEGTSLYWAGLNQGKRCVSVDFRSPRGRDLVARLATAPGPGGGLLISNTTAFEELRWAALATRRTDSIVMQLSGFRDGGSAIDFTIQAATGLHELTGRPSQRGPINNPMPFWDIACGLYLATGLLAAVHHRSATGHGQEVNLSLHDVALSAVSNLGFLADSQLNEKPRTRDGNYVFGTLGSDFETADGRRVMAVFLTKRHWRQMLQLTGLTDVVEALERTWAVDLDEDHARYVHREPLTALLRPWFTARTLAEVTADIATTSVLFSEYRTFADLVADDAADLRANPLFSELNGPGPAAYLAAGSPLVHDGHQVPAAPAPTIGAHTDEVLGEVLGCDTTYVNGLRREGVLA
jgi:2-methylfumaryl-CoA isomerase